jgi:hypothetical protein
LIVKKTGTGPSPVQKSLGVNRGDVNLIPMFAPIPRPAVERPIELAELHYLP